MAELEIEQIIAEEQRPIWRRWQLPAFLVIVAVVAAGAYVAFFRGDGRPAAVVSQEAKATVGALATTLTISGTAAAEQSSTLTFAASGVVTQVLAKVGDQVKAGQPIAKLDDRDAQRRFESAQSSLVPAQLRLQLLTDPPTAADLTAMQQAVQSARAQITSAQIAYNKLFQPTDADIAAADTALVQAKNALLNASNQVDSAKVSLVSAQDSYCFTPGLPLGVCAAQDLPLSQYAVDTLNSALQRHVLSSTGATRTAAFLQANSSYLNALTSRDSADASLRSAQSKRDALSQPPLDTDVQQARNAIESAQAALDSAIAKQQALVAGATATDLGLQQQAVRAAQIAVQQAQDALDDLTLTAPFGGTVGAVTYIAGQRSGSGTVVLTNPDAIRIDLTISETDLAGLKPGMLGIARFDSLPRNMYVVKVTGVSPVPTVTQGVVTYPVQTAILRGDALNEVRDQLPTLARALSAAGGTQLTALLGGQNGAGASGQGGSGGQNQRGAQGGQSATPGGSASRTPGASPSRTPGAAPSGTVTGGAGAGGTRLEALLNPPLPAAGMNASITLLLSVTDNQLLVPSGAVRRQGGRTFVYSPGESGAAPVQKPVVIGGTDGTNTAIVSGLNEGDTVLLGAIGTVTPTATRTTQPGGVGGPGGPGGGGGIR